MLPMETSRPAPNPSTLTLRQGLSLNGKWCYIVDLLDTGYYDYRRVPLDESTRPETRLAGFFLDYSPSDESERVEYRFDEALTLWVPGDWNSQQEKLFYYEGSVWYCRRFEYRKSAPEKRAFLHFGGVNYRADVYLNGRKLGFHVGGFTPFCFEVTDVIREGRNSLVVRANNTRAPENVPTLNSDWWNYGGITRDVSLVETPSAFIEDFTLQLKPTDPETLVFSARVNGPAVQPDVSLRIPEAGVDRKFPLDASGRLEASFRVKNLARWSPETPKRYRVEISFGDDRLEDDIGFRTLAVRGQDILLNGKPVFLRGVCIHEESPLKGGRATTIEEARMVLGWARELNCNFVRLAHYPHREDMVRAAEEMGLMVWSEIPVYWTIDWENPDTLQNAVNQLSENIGRDKNRACVIIWSVANETPPGEARNRFLSILARKARELDSSRLVSAALEKRYAQEDPELAMMEDPFAAECDVVSFNEYIGWYDGLPEKCDRVKWNIPYDKPVVVSEFGGDALEGLHGAPSARWTEEFQKDLYERTLAMLKKIPQLRGLTPWILADFRSPKRLLPHIQDGWNRKGLVSEKGRRKAAFAALRAFYASLA